MTITHRTYDCPACGKEYLIFVKFCKHFHPPLLYCPNGTSINKVDMLEGGCPSPVCPNSRNGGCSMM
ncbi:hypothetical protein QBC38DRAFT_509760 [Podospora fimiseda]|uniref:C2H2-type domain-containing protein n=1 Tax=Podospora fimiseda TaxID=252190 RepID=A0AAN7BPK9_9PEZI|nr:hypothetical protein QBC38DRAFT_509760 [Podospora fimiseda]